MSEDASDASCADVTTTGKTRHSVVNESLFQIVIMLREPGLQRVQRSARMMSPMRGEVETPSPYRSLGRATVIQNQTSLHISPDVCEIVGQICRDWILCWNDERIEAFRVVSERKRVESFQDRQILFVGDFWGVRIR